MQHIQQEKVTFEVGHEVLAGNIITNNAMNKPRLLFLHGGGKHGNKERVRNLAVTLAENNIPSCSFDFSGHGESTGKLEESSLHKRTLEAHAALQFLATDKPVTVCAFSMGGHIALELLKTHPISNLFLFCPAVYDKAAFAVPFNRGFSEIIRREESWRKTDVTEALESFTGNLFICIGERDTVIPTGVISLLDQASKNVRTKEIMLISGAHHSLLQWLSENNEYRDSVVEKMIRLVSLEGDL